MIGLLYNYPPFDPRHNRTMTHRSIIYYMRAPDEYALFGVLVSAVYCSLLASERSRIKRLSGARKPDLCVAVGRIYIV